MGSSRIEVLLAMLPAFAYFYNVGSVGFWLPLYLRELGWSYTLINLTASAYFVAVTLATPLAGLLSDATRRPWLVLTLGMTIASATSFILPHTSGALLIAVRAIQGAGLSAGIPVALGGLSLLKGVRRGAALTAAASGLGMSTGAASAGVLASLYGFTPIFYAAGVVAAVSAATSAIAWRPPPPPKGGGVFWGLRRVPWEVLAAMATLVVRNFFASGVFSILSIIFSRLIGLGYVATGLALAVNPLVQSINSYLIQGLVRGRALMLYSMGIAGTALVFQGYLAAESAWQVLAFQVAQGFFYSTTVVSGNVIMVSLSPKEIRYTASSFYSLAFNTGWILGTLASGPAMDALGVETWVNLASMGVALASLGPIIIAWRSRRARSL